MLLGVIMHMCVRACEGQRANLGGGLQLLLPTCLFSDTVFDWPGTHQAGDPCWPVSHRGPAAPASSVLGFQVCHQTPMFYMGPGIVLSSM